MNGACPPLTSNINIEGSRDWAIALSMPGEQRLENLK